MWYLDLIIGDQRAKSFQIKAKQYQKAPNIHEESQDLNGFYKQNSH